MSANVDVGVFGCLQARARRAGRATTGLASAAVCATSCCGAVASWHGHEAYVTARSLVRLSQDKQAVLICLSTPAVASSTPPRHSSATESVPARLVSPCPLPYPVSVAPKKQLRGGESQHSTALLATRILTLDRCRRRRVAAEARRAAGAARAVRQRRRIRRVADKIQLCLGTPLLDPAVSASAVRLCATNSSPGPDQIHVAARPAGGRATAL